MREMTPEEKTAHLEFKAAIARLQWLREITPDEMIDARLNKAGVLAEIVLCKQIIADYESWVVRALGENGKLEGSGE